MRDKWQSGGIAAEVYNNVIEKAGTDMHITVEMRYGGIIYGY